MKSSYLKPIIGVLILLFTSFSACEKEKLLGSACGIENPDRNLPWLADMLYNITDVSLPEIQNVDLYKYNTRDIIKLSWKNDYQIYDAPTGAIYDCDGNYLYTCGGNQPVDSCSILVNKSQYIGRIWEKD